MLQALALLGAYELSLWQLRRQRRQHLYAEAMAHARRDGVPLVVVGAPDLGATRGPGCGDVCVDIEASRCPVFVQADVCERLPFDDNSCVVMVSCVLEYVADYEAAVTELKRISGGRMYVCRVEWYSLVAYLYPGAKRILPKAVELSPARALRR